MTTPLCTCTDFAWPCPACEPAFLAHEMALADAEAQRQAKEWEQSAHTCSRCGGSAHGGYCDDAACHEEQCRQHWLDQLVERYWEIEGTDEEEDPECAGKPDCQHTWSDVTFDNDADVIALRHCTACGRRERQVLFLAPESPNCYIPGEGWRLI